MLLQTPDQTLIDVPLEHMVVKDAVFIPTLHPVEFGVVVRRAAREIGFRVTTQQKIHDGYFGLMIWRTA